MQLGKKLRARGLRQPIMTLPAALLLLLGLLGVLVLAHHSVLLRSPASTQKAEDGSELLQHAESETADGNA